ncbi:hypothetical protein DFH07DRAFT_883431 [Mycena maculata]|uniref:Mitochondrial import inner membrane translocase subunit TIM50 n=1 Tax=Mycena maculata TaxID=230809 RepID=A0AAD7JGG2_9AGAR|nr:hypothetical protein DFH07DRAFT_883431 [Mycena maculata]
MAGPYYSYGGNQGFYTPEYDYYQLSSSEGYADGYYVRDYGSYGYNYGDYIAQSVPPPQRTPTPPPPPAEPSPEYLAASLAAQPASLPPGQRKLLIFDLNGTLLLRSPRNYGTRKIYLRPYARALVAYIAHPAVRTWLDCMVWSSAQAHNVREMVERVFGAGEGAGNGPILRAVWARDTLGLGREAFPKSSAPASQSLDVPPSDSAPPPLTYAHGPHSTLLVDDSPLKARLQPWNHLCVAEYDAPARARDRAAAHLPPDAEPSHDPAPHSTGGKAGNPLTAELAALAQESAAAADGLDANTGEPYEPTLLAVVGVLAHVRTVGNVAAWVRGGGLAADPIGAAAPLSAPEAEPGLAADPAQWFASRRLLTAWAARGRAALTELGIDAAPGVE